jgi:hypothetical protein
MTREAVVNTASLFLSYYLFDKATLFENFLMLSSDAIEYFLSITLSPDDVVTKFGLSDT